ncbi:MAG: DUF4276 family protein [Microcystaceae cyanobacterium]
MSYSYDLVFLLEERSMKELLENLLPRIIPTNITFICIAHEGKQDLEKSIPRKLKAWETKTQFIILRDQDSGSCFKIKEQLLDLCEKGRRKDSVVRIVCRELESWFLGDLLAVEKAFKKSVSHKQNHKKFRNPDKLNSAKQELRRLVPEYKPISGSRAIAQYLDLKNNTSKSFQVFIDGLNKIIEQREQK